MSPNQLHIVMFPLMAQGHMIPMMDIAKILLQHNKYIIITIVTTPYNASRFSSTFSHLINSGYQIRVELVQFPSKESNFPNGYENLDTLPSMSMALNFFNATKFLREPVEKLFEDLTPTPNCIISDMCLSYTRHISKKFNIPRISFGGVGCFYLFCQFCINNSEVSDTITDETEYFVVPGVPDRIEVTKAQIVSATDEKWKLFNEEMIAAESVTYGVIMNSFEELEPAYVREYRNIRKNRVWCFGPVSLCNKEKMEKLQRGKKGSIDEWKHLKWLDSQKPRSVIYACLGSLSNLVPQQLIELGLALESSKRPFIWVIREGKQLEELEKWIKENGIEERVKNRGLIIHGWAPQLLILSHFAIGGFITHCGWNSTLEGVCSGVPMITWPQFGDQFFNEKLVVEILKVGVKVGVERAVIWGKEEEIGVLVKKEDVERGIEELMGETKEREERRERVREIAEKAKIAVEEGGSSYNNVTRFIQDILQEIRD